MITLTITAEDGQSFIARFQNKVLENGAMTWADAEVNHEVGKSQTYGVNENFRLIVESVT